MKYKTPILILLLLILTPFVLADAEQYLNHGVTRDTTYQQDGTGVWTGRTPTTYSRTDPYYYQAPYINDIDNDGINEIVVATSTPSIQILNYTVGAGLVLEAEHSMYGVTTIGKQWNQTITGIDHDDDNLTEIMYYDYINDDLELHVIQWNGTALTSEQNITIEGGASAANLYNVIPNPVIKCSPGTTMLSGNDTCFLAYGYGNVEIRMAACDVDRGFCDVEATAYTNNNYAVVKGSSMHVTDIDNDGYVEALLPIRYIGGTPTHLIVQKFEIAANTVLTESQVFDHNMGGSVQWGWMSNILVYDLDGSPANGKEVSYLWSSDGTNWGGRTYSSDGSLQEATYCTALTCPEGNMAYTSNLMVASDTTYCDYSGDVYAYIRNEAENDPGANIDTVLCLSRYAGSSFKETEVSNLINLSFPVVAHQVSLYGSTGILLNKFAVQGGTKQSLPIIEGEYTLPVDVQKSGSLDIIGVSDNLISYYDDAYTNANYDITGLAWDTGSPICQYELPSYTLTVTDDEGDSGDCYFTETAANNSLHSTSDNQTISEGDMSDLSEDVVFNYYADEVGSFTLTFYCRDQYSGVLDSKIYTVTVGNDTDSCFYKFQGGGEVSVQTAADEADDAEFTEDVESLACTFFLCSPVARTIGWLLLMLVVGATVAIALAKNNLGSGIPVILAGVMLMMLLIGWAIGFISSVIIFILGLFLALIFAIVIFTNRGGG